MCTKIVKMLFECRVKCLLRAWCTGHDSGTPPTENPSGPSLASQESDSNEMDVF